jgi:hypothetical protein
MERMALAVQLVRPSLVRVSVDHAQVDPERAVQTVRLERVEQMEQTEQTERMAARATSSMVVASAAPVLYQSTITASKSKSQN